MLLALRHHGGMAIDGAAWLGFGGVVAGAALGYASSAIQEHAHRRHDDRRAREQADREDRVRFEERRFDSYVAVIETANRLYAAAKYPGMAWAELSRRDQGEDSEGRSPVTDPGAYVEQLQVTYAEFRGALSPAFIVTSSVRTRDTIADLATAVNQLFKAATKDRQPDNAHRPLYYAHRQGIRRAEAAMRAEFGIVADPSPEPDGDLEQLDPSVTGSG